MPGRGQRDAPNLLTLKLRLRVPSSGSGREVLRRDGVEELPELLDLVLLLVRDLDPGGVQDGVRTENLDLGPQREREGVGRARAHGDTAAEAQFGVVDVVAQFGDVNGLEPDPERL